MTNAATVLIVDDEPHIRRLLQTMLDRAGYRVTQAGAARQVLTEIEANPPDVILLDLGLPDRDGLELLPLIRQKCSAAVLVVSARESTDEKVAALDLGAIDYVTKPFDTEELLARVRVALRSRLTAEGGKSALQAGDVTIDLVERRILKRGVEIHLTPKEFAIVAELAHFPGRVVTHAKLLSVVWPNDHDRHIEYLRVIVRNIRQKLEDDAATPKLLVNELGVGYRLIEKE